MERIKPIADYYCLSLTYEDPFITYPSLCLFVTMLVMLDITFEKWYASSKLIFVLLL